MACTFTFCSTCLLLFLFMLTQSKGTIGKKEKSKEEKEASEKWKKKDIRDYSDADLERLFDQWEDADDDELEEDELPEWKREPPKMDMSQIDPSNPEGTLKMSKKGRTMMLFATVSGNPTQAETDTITQIWQSSLFNANYEMQRYPVSENRVIFMLKDGAMAWEIKDFLVQQDRCEEVTVEGKSYPGKDAKPDSSDSKEDSTASKKSKSKKSDTKKSKHKKSDKDNETKPKTEL